MRQRAVHAYVRARGTPGTGHARRAESHATRSAVTGPLLRVRLLLPELADAAQHAVQAVYGMRAADSTATLQEARERALQAADDLTAAGAAARRVAARRGPPGGETGGFRRGRENGEQTGGRER